MDGSWVRGWPVRAAGRRRDLVLPSVLLVLQLAATFGAEAHGRLPGRVDAVGWVVLVVGPVALVFRRRHPVAVMWLALLVALPPTGARLAYLSVIAAVFLAAAEGHRRAAWSAIVFGCVCSLWLLPPLWGHRTATLDGALLLGGWLALLAVAAELMRLRRERVEQARAARQAELLHRAGEERLRMARDLHDVVGHTMSLINVQAAVGLDLMDHSPEQARESLRAIRSASKEALDELRTMLAAFRREGEDAPRAPTPGLDRLPDLVARTRATGLHVTTELAEAVGPLPAAVDLAAYRIVQESLTNVTRHAGAGTATVRIGRTGEELVVEVSDDGRGAAGGGEGCAGSGIVGMRERAGALGGSLAAGPRPGGGFAVSARLPIGGEP